MKPILLDSGVIVATFNQSDRFHRICAEALGQITAPLYTCESVIAESCHITRNHPGARETLLENIATRVIQIPLSLSEMARPVRLLLAKYKDQGIDLADACLIQMANELETDQILTIDSDFKVYRWGRNRPFHCVLGLW